MTARLHHPLAFGLFGATSSVDLMQIWQPQQNSGERHLLNDCDSACTQQPQRFFSRTCARCSHSILCSIPALAHVTRKPSISVRDRAVSESLPQISLDFVEVLASTKRKER